MFDALFHFTLFIVVFLCLWCNFVSEFCPVSFGAVRPLLLPPPLPAPLTHTSTPSQTWEDCGSCTDHECGWCVDEVNGGHCYPQSDMHKCRTRVITTWESCQVLIASREQHELR